MFGCNPIIRHGLFLPDLYERLAYREGGGSNYVVGSFCELVGAEFCFGFDDNMSAASCLENDAIQLVPRLFRCWWVRRFHDDAGPIDVGREYQQLVWRRGL